MGPGPCPCLRPVRTFLYSNLEPIDPGPIFGSVAGPVQCEYTMNGSGCLYHFLLKTVLLLRKKGFCSFKFQDRAESIKGIQP